MLFYKNICSEAFETKNINSDILEMNKNISALIQNMPPSHEIPFEVLSKIRSEGGGMLPNQPKIVQVRMHLQKLSLFLSQQNIVK